MRALAMCMGLSLMGMAPDSIIQRFRNRYQNTADKLLDGLGVSEQQKLIENTTLLDVICHCSIPKSKGHEWKVYSDTENEKSYELCKGCWSRKGFRKGDVCQYLEECKCSKYFCEEYKKILDELQINPEERNTRYSEAIDYCLDQMKSLFDPLSQKTLEALWQLPDKVIKPRLPFSIDKDDIESEYRFFTNDL